jgi:hypothetical protein
MKNFIQPHQNTIAQSLDYSAAQAAIAALQAADFPPEQFSLIPEEIDPNVAVGQTEAAKGAGVGATTGAVFGGLMGGLIAYASMLSAGNPLSTTHLLGLVLAGSSVGAAAVSILGALTGANVHQGQDTSVPNQYYVLVADVSQDELLKAQKVLQEAGVEVVPN